MVQDYLQDIAAYARYQASVEARAGRPAQLSPEEEAAEARYRLVDHHMDTFRPTPTPRRRPRSRADLARRAAQAADPSMPPLEAVSDSDTSMPGLEAISSDVD